MALWGIAPGWCSIISSSRRPFQNAWLSNALFMLPAGLPSEPHAFRSLHHEIKIYHQVLAQRLSKELSNGALAAGQQQPQ